jgi:NAD+ synthase (glutamine-hydrolysing)
LWDYLRKSKAGGFFLPLSGGMDSSSVALMVYNMCIIVFKEITERKNQTVLKDLRQIIENPNF